MLRRFGLGRSVVAPAMQLIVEEDLVPPANRTFYSDDHQESSPNHHRPGPNLRPNYLVTQTAICQLIIAATASHEQTAFPVLGRMGPIQQV